MQPFTFFISYRRQYTAPIALLLKYEIEKRLQFVRVFVDVEDIRHGDVFPDRIKQMIDKAHAAIVLIGSNWMPRRGQLGSGEVSASVPADEDWIVKELVHSLTRPIDYDEENRCGLSKRVLLPIFVDCEPTFDQFDLPTAIVHLAESHGQRIDCASWPTTIGPLIEKIAVRLNLKERPDAEKFPHPDPSKASTQPVSDEELRSTLKYEDYDGWYLDNFGNAEVRYLVKTFEFPHFNQAADFMELVAKHCRVLDHHPEWRNVYNYVTVSLTTWDARRQVTIYDLNLALFMNKAERTVRAKFSQ